MCVLNFTNYLGNELRGIAIYNSVTAEDSLLIQAGNVVQKKKKKVAPLGN